MAEMEAVNVVLEAPWAAANHLRVTDADVADMTSAIVCGTQNSVATTLTPGRFRAGAESKFESTRSSR